MCFDPVSMSVIGGIASAAGTVFSAVQSVQSYNAQAKIAERQAQIERDAGNYEAKRRENANSRQLAGMRSAYLSSGIGLTGSAVDVIADSATEASLDEQAIRYGSKIKSDNLMMEAKMAKMNAGMAGIGGAIGAMSGMVNSFSSVRSLNQNRTMVSNPYGSYDPWAGLR